MKISTVRTRGRDIPFVAPDTIMPRLASGVVELMKTEIKRAGGTVATGIETVDCTGFPVLNTLQGVDGCAPVVGSGVWVQLSSSRGVPARITGQPPFPFISLSGPAAFAPPTTVHRGSCDLTSRISLVDRSGNAWGLDGLARSTDSAACPARSAVSTEHFQLDSGDSFTWLTTALVGTGTGSGPGAAAMGPANIGVFCAEVGYYTQGISTVGSTGVPFVKGACALTGCGYTKTDDVLFSVMTPAIYDSGGLSAQFDFGRYGVMAMILGASGPTDYLSFLEIPSPDGGGAIDGLSPGADMHIFAGEEGSVYAMRTGNPVVFRYRWDRSNRKLVLVKKIVLDQTEQSLNSIMLAYLEGA